MKGAGEITLSLELESELCLGEGLSLFAKYLAKLLRVDEPFRAEATVSETRDGLLCLKGEEDFVLLLRGSMRTKQTAGRRRWEKPVGQCDTGEVMGEGSMESPLCEMAKGCQHWKCLLFS